MAGSFLLDTNIVIAHIGADSAIVSRVAASPIYLPVVVLGELYFGARKSIRIDENVAKINTYARRFFLVVCDAGTAEVYGRIRDLLRRKGRPIPDADICIAAFSVQHDLMLVSRDQHFKEVDGLKWEVW